MDSDDDSTMKVLAKGVAALIICCLAVLVIVGTIAACRALL